jgi:hypothetical protein
MNKIELNCIVQQIFTNIPEDTLVSIFRVEVFYSNIKSKFAFSYLITIKKSLKIRLQHMYAHTYTK